jgi:glycosidase
MSPHAQANLGERRHRKGEAAMVEQRLSDLEFALLLDRDFHPSPVAWEDQVFYFLLLDRFSDGREDGYLANDGRSARGTTPLFRSGDAGNAIGTAADAERWREAGRTWAGGTLRGLASKMGYLQRLGVTAVWVSPVFKQVASVDSYHGYGVQNFLDVDPHFGDRDDLRRMVETAHAHGIRVVLDVILNHSGNVFAYDPDRYWTDDGRGGRFLDPRWDGRPYRVAGYRDAGGGPSLPFGAIDLAVHEDAWPDGAIWPAELQPADRFTQKGRIDNWDYDPEFREGDFADLKDIHLGSGDLDNYAPSDALATLCRAYKFWIAFADLDGFRIDTVKHMDPGAVRFLASVIHEFAQRLGKENFSLIGEITGGRQRAYETLEVTGLDAALGIDDVPDKLEGLVKGFRAPGDYFDLFRNSLLVRKESHVWFRNKVVTVIDDHDQVRKGQQKARFCAGDDRWRRLALPALALNATTLGIPCIYYGSEQRFDGAGGDDRYLREAMFGGEFGPFRSRDRHCFDETTPVYRELSRILAVRRAEPTLRRGRQYLRDISGDGVNFGPPVPVGGELRSVVAWSRIFDERELVVAINTDAGGERSAWVTIDAGLHREGDVLRCLYPGDGPVTAVPVEARNGLAVRLTVPAAGFVIYG